MKYLLLAAGLALISLPGQSRAEFYVWRDAHGVRQVSNVPPRCIRGHHVLANCLVGAAPLADPNHVSALNDKQYEALLKQRHERAARRQSEQVKQAVQAGTAARAVNAAEQERESKRRELRKQLDAAQDEAQMKFLHGHDVPGPLLKRIDRLRAELKALESPPGDS